MCVCVFLFLFLLFFLPRGARVRGVHFQSRREAETQPRKQPSQIICHSCLYLFMPRTVASLSPAAQTGGRARRPVTARGGGMLNLPLQDILGWFSEVRKVNTNIQAWQMDVNNTSGRLTCACVQTHEISGRAGGSTTARLFHFLL